MAALIIMNPMNSIHLEGFMLRFGLVDLLIKLSLVKF